MADAAKHKPLVFSGMQPTNTLHLGNYLGALKNWVKLQERMPCIYCVVDMHAITAWQEPKQLADATYEVAAAYIAAGGEAARTPYAYQRYVFVTNDRDEARRAAEGARYIRRVAMSMRNQYAQLDGAFLKEMPAPDEPPLDEIVERLVVGDAETCAAKLIREFEVLRPTHMTCFMAIPGIAPDRILKSMERFGADVMPAIARHFGGLDRIGAPEPRERLAPARRAAAAG